MKLFTWSDVAQGSRYKVDRPLAAGGKEGQTHPHLLGLETMRCCQGVMCG